MYLIESIITFKINKGEKLIINQNISFPEHKTSYEIVKHPHYSHVDTHSSSVDYEHGGGGYEGGSRRRRGARRRR